MSWGGALAGALREALSRPRLWALALGATLVRGGIVVLLMPIVLIPTPAGLANLLAPTLVGFVFEGVSPSFVVLVAALVAGAATWLLAGGFLAAILDGEVLTEVLQDMDPRGVGEPDLGPPGGHAGLALAWRGLVARLLAHLPTAVALGWGAVRLVNVTYAELIDPGAADVPIPIRVIQRIPEVVVLITALWAAGEAAGGIAHRRLALERRSIPAAVLDGWLDLVRRPTMLVTALGGTAMVVGTLVVAGLAAELGWDQVRVAIVDRGGQVETLVLLLLFAAIWLAGLFAVALAAAWRSTGMALETLRHRQT